MASIILSSVGSMLGNQLLPGIGGRIVSALGRRVGKLADEALGLSTGGSASDGTRLESLRMQDSRYGIGIPKVFGRVRIAGNVIWVSDLIETVHEDKVFGGKGGGVSGIISGSSGSTTRTYSVHAAIALAAGEIGGIASIWADSKLIYNNGKWTDGVLSSATIYNGTAQQGADPLLQSWTGGNTPAYRGVAYIVLEALQLSNFGNRLPNLTFEVYPPRVSPEPQWLGAADPDVLQPLAAVRGKALAPLVIDSSTSAARRVIVAGYEEVGAGQKRLAVVEYDVTDTIPVALNRAVSASFAASDIGDMAWAMDASGRWAAIYTQSVGENPSHRFVLYDVRSRQFGDVLALNLPFSADYKQVAWLDALHFVVTDSTSGRRGLRLLARVGHNVADRGFYDVWGSGSAASRVPLLHANFTPLAGGLVYYTVNSSTNFTTLHACYVMLQEGGAVAAGIPWTVATGLATGDGSGLQATLLESDAGEWTLCLMSALDMRLLSFRPAVGSSAVTRPWQVLGAGASEWTVCRSAALYGNHIVVLQRGVESYNYTVLEVLLRDNDFALEGDGAAVSGYNAAATDFSVFNLGRERLLVAGVGGQEYGGLHSLGIVRLRDTGDNLANIVGWIMGRAGYAAADMDLSALAGVAVEGYVLPDPMTAAAAIAPLQVFEPFSLVESDSRLTVRRHGQEAVVAIPDEATAAVNGVTEEARDAALNETLRMQELDLPIEATVDYLDATLDYEVGSQRARRLATKGAKAAVKISLPLVCSAADAKRIAEHRLFTAWGERERVTVCLSRQWLGLEPGDAITVAGRTSRITSSRLESGVLELHGVARVTMPTAAVVADNGAAGDTVGAADNSNALYLLDLPLLRDGDDQSGVYAAISGNGGGASLWRASDGVNFSRLAGFTAAATAGAAVTALPDAPAYYADRANSLTVQLRYGELASCSEGDWLNGANVAVLGNEIIQFQNAVLVDDGLYVLSNLLRGRRGTESATGTHTVGERFVLLTAGTVQFLPALATDRGRTYAFRAVGDGQTIGSVADRNFTYGLATLRPLSPVHVTCVRSGDVGSDVTISWKRRARRDAEWLDNIDVPLDEASEIYDVEIMNGTSVVRTFSAVAGTSQVYTAAQQLADWGAAVPEALVVRVYQVGGRYGRGSYQ